MSDVRDPQSPDSRDLAKQGLADELFPGGRTAGFRAFFSPQVHAALWRHASGTSFSIPGRSIVRLPWPCAIVPRI